MRHVFGAVLLALCACGGEGGDLAAEDAQLMPETPTGTITCYHDGGLFVCNDEQCWEDSEYKLLGAVEGAEGSWAIREKLDISGPVTIIAECGSNVVFNAREDNSETTTSATAELSNEL